MGKKRNTFLLSFTLIAPKLQLPVIGNNSYYGIPLIMVDIRAKNWIRGH